jgi:hypothetical protein
MPWLSGDFSAEIDARAGTKNLFKPFRYVPMRLDCAIQSA